MATLSLRGLMKRYGDATAVNHVSIDIADGEFVSLLGPSGCGKSTILNMIAGLLDPDDGTVVIGGRDVTRATPRDRKIAMVFQDYALYPHMTVSENMAFPLKAVAMPAADITEHVQAAATRLGIADLLDRRPAELSGGQRQRVALGRATVRTPSVFLMDEPLSNLDAKLRVQMRAELKLLSQRLRTTTVYVTHDQSEAMTLSDRVAIMSRGQLQQFGTPLDVYRAPANVFVANFMGMMPMNFVAGSLHGRRDGSLFRSPWADVEVPGATPGDGIDRAALMAVRPEDLSLDAAGIDAPTLQINVDVIEHLGADLYVHGALGDSRVVVRARPDAAVRMGPTRVRIDTRAVHFFDAATQARLFAVAGGPKA
jgi:multiple sugar transport system ATP-binding protein